MPRNIEIKAKVRNLNEIISKAKKICGSEAKILNQVDTFFTTPTGRLKLRNFQDGSPSELIFYERSNIQAPKLSNYSICLINNPDSLLNVLKSALGVIGTIKKIRYLFIYEQTRIHIDLVEDLGNFVELEVTLSSDQSIEEGEATAYFLMDKLDIFKEDLIDSAYLDLLNNIE